MKKFSCLVVSIWCLLLSDGQLRGQVPGQEGDPTFSPNKKFSVEISQTQLDKPLLTVFRHDGGKPVQVWSRSLVEKEEDDDGQTPFFGLPYRRTVGNDGSFVVLRSPNLFDDGPALRVLRQKGGDKSFSAEDLTELLDDETEDPTGMETGYLELMVETGTPRLYGLWHPAVKQWLALDLDKLTLQKADATLQKKLDGLALPHARELVRLDQPGPLKKMLKPLLQKAAEFVSGPAQPPNGWEEFGNRAEPAYRFLAHQKNPQDKKAIEALLEREITAGFSMGIPGWGDPWAGLRSEDRALGDELLGAWDGKSKPEASKDEDDFFMHGLQKPLHYFGGVSGRINLPFAVPDKAGAVWVYLIPAKVSPGAWQKDKSVLKVRWDTANPSMPAQFQGEPADHLNFFFDTLAAGEYRVKAVWDRRAPHAADDPEAIGIPGPGDYESAESAPLKVAAGTQIKDFELHCTNRVGQAAEYYAADEAWKKENPVTSGEEEERFPGMRPTKMKVLVNAPLTDWLIKTNENSGSIGLKKVRLMGSVSEGKKERRTLSVKFTMPKPEKDHAMIRGKLVDEHGCVFETHGFNTVGRTYEVSFDTIPFGSKEMVMMISRDDQEDENGRPFPDGSRETVLGSFTLKNLFAVKPEEWKADAPPVRRDLDIVSVELTSFNRDATEFQASPFAGMGDYHPGGFGFPGMGRQLQPPAHKFAFSAQGKAAVGWRKVSGDYTDRWGNESRRLADFCKEEEVFKYTARFARDPEKAIFTADEKLEIPVNKIPGAGENVPLRIHKEIQGVSFRALSLSGTGEFTYKNGELVSAQEKIDDEEFVSPFAGSGRAVQPKMYLKGNRGQGHMGMDWAGASGGSRVPVTVVSRIPHVACRVPYMPSDTLFALVEQDTSVPEPMNAPSRGMPYFSHGPRRPNPIQFLPLDFRSGDTDKKLTFVVQKTRQAEFFVRVLKNERRQRIE